MRTGLAVLIVVSCLAAAVIAQNPTPQGGQIFRSGSRTVAVYVTVSDEQGRLVPNLTQDDFEIYDNGKKQTITVFENGSQPITLVMMLDRSGSMVGNFGLVRSAAEQFVGQLLPGAVRFRLQSGDGILDHPRPFLPRLDAGHAHRRQSVIPDIADGSRQDDGEDRRRVLNTEDGHGYLTDWDMGTVRM